MRREYILGDNMSALICVLNNAILHKEVEVKIANTVTIGEITKIDGRYVGDKSILYLSFRTKGNGLPIMIDITSGDKIAFDLDRAEIYYSGVVGEVVRIDSVKNDDTEPQIERK